MRRCTSTSAARDATGRRQPTRSRRRSHRSSASSATASRWRPGATSFVRIGCPRRCGQSCRCCCTSPRQERARMEGAGGGVRGDADQSACAARAVRRDPLVARLSLRRVPRPRVSERRRRSRRGAALPELPELPVADVRAFSIDDRTTTEIDDAFSVRELANGHHEIGIHIAAPALVDSRAASPLDAIARARLSTVYMPGRKITMLPEVAIEAFTLCEGRSPPALSLYVEVAPDGAARSARHARRTRAGRRQPAPRCDRARRSRIALRVAVGSRVDGRASRPVDSSRRRSSAQRGKADFQRSRLQLLRRLGRGPRTAGSRSFRGRAARRSTSSSPSS